MSFSYAQIGGTLGRDPETRATPSGAKNTTFSVAVEKGYGDKKRTVWYNVVAWEKNSEFAEKYLKKGSNVLVTGDLDIDSWDDKQTGAKRTAIKVVAYKIDFGEKGSSSSRTESAPRQAAAPATRQQAVPETRSNASYTIDDDEDSIPF